MSKLRILIIGAGVSGLPAIKCCLDEGLEPVCLERSGDVGGLWNFENSLKARGEIACVTRSTIINTSKEIMSYSDFPVPEEFPNFMPNKLALQYIRLYADKFKLKDYIQLNTEVVRVRPADNFDSSGQWEAKIRNCETSKERIETFDAVMVCTGHHAHKHMPHFEGEENFKGTRIHTHDFHDSQGYNGKRVVVIGIGNSAGDAAVELSRICDQVYLSTRRGSWVTGRIGRHGMPADLIHQRRFANDVTQLMPRWLFNSMVEKQLNAKFDHARYGLKPTHRFDEQHSMVNDDLPNALASGMIRIKPNVRRLTATGVEFEDGSVVDNIDVILYGTGYEFGFPFVDHKALTVVKNDVSLYKLVFPPDIRPSTLAVIGCVQPAGPTFPIAEMQCRWATRVFKGETPLPSSEEMWNDVKRKKTEMADRFYTSQRHTIQVKYIPYMDELADLVGCRPDFIRLFQTDPKLALQMYFGPMTPFQYRVMGHGAWQEARKTILTTWDRVWKPLSSQVATRPTRRYKFGLFVLTCVILLLAIVTCYV